MVVACLLINPVLPANRLIHIVTAYLNGLSLLDDLTVLIGPQDHGCPFSTPAYRPDFADLIRQAKEALRPLKEVSLEIGPKTEAHDRGAKLIDDSGQGDDLRSRQELGLVHEDATKSGIALQHLREHDVKRIVIRHELDARSIYPDAGGDLPLTGTGVYRGGEQDGPHAL